MCCSIRQYALTVHDDLDSDELFTAEPARLHSFKSQKPSVLHTACYSVILLLSPGLQGCNAWLGIRKVIWPAKILFQQYSIKGFWGLLWGTHRLTHGDH